MSLYKNRKVRIDLKHNINYEIQVGDRCIVTDAKAEYYAGQIATVMERRSGAGWLFTTDGGESFELGPSQGCTSTWAKWLPEQLNKFEE